MKKALVLSVIFLCASLGAEIVVRTGELGAYAESGVSSGFWVVSDRTTPTSERSAVVVAPGSGYDTRTKTMSLSESVIAVLRRVAPGLLLLFR